MSKTKMKLLIHILIIVLVFGCRDKKQPVADQYTIVCNTFGKYALRIGDRYLRIIDSSNRMSFMQEQYYSGSDTFFMRGTGGEKQFDTYDKALLVKSRFEYIDSVAKVIDSVYQHKKHIRDSIEKLNHQYKECK